MAVGSIGFLKSVESGVTRTSLQELTEEERVKEIRFHARG